jgi:predicted amidohydrolase YtcJ
MTERSASLLLHGGVIQGRADCDSIAIRAGRIAALGKFDDVRPLAGQKTRFIALNGAAVWPGFSDCHLHFFEAASVAAGLDLSSETSLDRVLARLREWACRAPSGAWVKAFGCDEARLVERRGPTLAELDQAVPRNPLRLRHQTLHASWLNSRAAEILGLKAPALAPGPATSASAKTEEASDGLVVGMEGWLSRRVPKMSRGELEACSRAFSDALARAGITRFTDAGANNGVEKVELFSQLVGAGVVRQKVSLMLGAEHLAQAQDAQRLAEKAGLRLCGVKFMPTDAMRREGFGPASEVELGEWVRLAWRARELGLACAFHVTEVEELEAALNVIERVQARVGATDVFAGESSAKARFRIEHGSLIPPNYLERLAACGAWVVSNPGFLYFRGRKYVHEPGLFPYLFALRALIDAGIPVAGASDAPVTPARPLAAVCAAVRRRSLEGDEFCPKQALSVHEALSLFTDRAAQLDGDDGGRLAVGAFADLVVLSPNPSEISFTNSANKTMSDVGAVIAVLDPSALNDFTAGV